MHIAQQPGPLSAAPASDRLRQQAQELEGVFLTSLVKEMFAGLESKGAFGGGFAEETWRGMQAEHYAATMAENGGIGLADALLSDLLRLQEAAQTTAAMPQLPKGPYQ